MTIKRCQCAICGKKITIKILPKGKYTGGYYFGKISLFTKREQQRSLKAGTRQTKIAGQIVNVLNEDPKAYDYAEYWECDECNNKKA